VAGGGWTPETKLTVQDFVETQWLPSISAAVKGGSLKPTNEASCKHLMARHAVPQIGAVQLAGLATVMLNDLYDQLLTSGRMNGKGLSPTTVHMVHVAIHRMLKDAGTWGLLPRNFADHVTRPRPTSPEMSPWTPDQTRQFISGTCTGTIHFTVSYNTSTQTTNRSAMNLYPIGRTPQALVGRFTIKLPSR